MTEKRANIGIWKISIPERRPPADHLSSIIAAYGKLARMDEGYSPLTLLPLNQSFGDVHVELYIRVRRGLGIYSFLAEHLADTSDKNKFKFRAVDTCIFMLTDRSLFAVTTGSAYHIIEEYADLDFPFEVAKRVLANNFKAADVRQITGITTSRVETYRRGQSISNSESLGKVWKRLVGRLNTRLLSEDSYLSKLIDPSRPPTVEVKSSLILKKSLDLRQITRLVQELEDLPDITEEQRVELSFLDNLHQVKSKQLIQELDRELVEALRRLSQNPESDEDLDVCDPDDVSQYYSGYNYQLGYMPLDGDPPSIDDVGNLIRLRFPEDHLQDGDVFFQKINSMHIRYQVDEGSQSSLIRKPLLKLLHGQVAHKNVVYFRLDKIWYQVRGDFLSNLERDFIRETFANSRPILLSSSIGFLKWRLGEDEGKFNDRQARQPGFYFGDQVFAKSSRGKVELFDLLYVDTAKGELYIIHAKDGFDAKMRDACSQISMSAEVIEQDLVTGKTVLAKYFDDWQGAQPDKKRAVTQDQFLGWFSEYSRTYLVLASTRNSFTRKEFERGTYKSHIARREVIAVRNEFRYSYATCEFRLAHTPKTNLA